ncbi:MAG: helix-turn-helix transcriptional regulator [Eubacterium sp.]|nr:helix-turn-helix transcriptional regulator [Eubacterium sp.]
MKDRIKKIRKELDLTQQEFADRIGVKRGGIANYEIGRNEPTDSVISLICREFNVNEDWLRTGEGEMFIKLTRDEEMAKLTKQLLNEEEDSFKNRLISVLANLTDQQWEVLAEVAEKLSNEKAND